MRRLDDALVALAEQDVALEIDDVIADLERRLAGEREAVVVSLPGAMEGPVTQPAPRRRWRPAVAVVAAALALLVAIGLPLVLLRSDDRVVDEPTTTVATTIAPTTTVTSTTAAPDTSSAPSPTTSTTVAAIERTMGWTELGVPPAFDGFAYSQVNALIEGGPGFVAVGDVVVGVVPEGWREVTIPPELHWDAAVWLSADGIEWERVVDPALEGLDPAETGGLTPDDQSYLDQMMLRVAAGPDGLVAIGNDGLAGVAWYSPDGRVWTEAVLPGGVFHSINGVTAGGPGWVVVGNDGSGNAAVWTSPDGLEWTSVEDDALRAEEGSRADIVDVVAGRSGIVAVGYTGFEDSDVRSAVWVSADGVDWERTSEGALGDVFLFTVHYEPQNDGFLTFAPPPQWPPNFVAWHSDDGVRWQATESPSPDHWADVAFAGDRIVGFGQGNGTWISADGGETWERTLDQGPVYGALTRDGRVIGMGWGGEVWLGVWTDR